MPKGYGYGFADDPRYEYDFRDRLADFLLGMSGLAGQTGQVLRQQELDQENQAVKQFNLMTSLAKLQDDQAARARKDQLAGFRRSGMSKLVQGQPPESLSPDEMEALGDVQQSSLLGSFLFPKKKEPPKRNVVNLGDGRLVEIPDAGPPQEIYTAPPRPKEPKAPERVEVQGVLLERDPGTGKWNPVYTAPKEPKSLTSALAHIAEAIDSLARQGIATPTEGQIGAELRRLDEASRTRTAVTAAQAPYLPMTPGAGPAGTAAPEAAAPIPSATAQATGGRPVSPPMPGESAFGYKTRIERSEPTAAEKNREMAGMTIEGILNRLETLIDAGAFEGVGEGLLGRAAGAVTQGVSSARQSNQALEMYESLKEGVLANPVRFMGDVGTLNEGDIQRARNLFGRAKPGFEGSMNPLNWVVLPDTPTTARNKIQQFRELIAEIKARPENRTSGPAGALVPTRGRRTIRTRSGKTIEVEDE
jgi:hypothetical protein